ncbi:MAG: hypothetical protein A3D65_01070 [Candidatus Lloydbacteria bacterium RIFCSPHIGHO2_02_FULL_50_13]|uniref:Uncharacterized protein n=1 Tax=Candidatus Lloydbacteria bacterium RIFCSPHIGHO2_02_FULL_50_13 TaxID=1798661 RepID=A0A1G2D462_9BACT|nr:MAG: hypothetical protein A3D65_01070 [Candidatus Lloydbacteria bacterium RIFCSPHIGHO2_02_FULL_50_13]
MTPTFVWFVALFSFSIVAAIVMTVIRFYAVGRYLPSAIFLRLGGSVHAVVLSCAITLLLNDVRPEVSGYIAAIGIVSAFFCALFLFEIIDDVLAGRQQKSTTK